MIKIAICGEVYSENLGDGIIANSLKWLLLQNNPHIKISFVDFRCRDNYPPLATNEDDIPGSIRKLHVIFSQSSLYRKLSIPTLWYISKRKKFIKYCYQRIIDCDLVIIGGGQLLMDNNLNFPLKVREIIRISALLKKKVIFVACGVGRRWSALGIRTLKAALTNHAVKLVSVRDQGSLKTLMALIPEAESRYSIIYDPAICAADAYNIKPKQDNIRIGLGISAPKELKRNLNSYKRFFSRKNIEYFWLELIEQLTSNDYKIALFTNGDPEDYDFTKIIWNKCYKLCHDGNIALLSRPTTPSILMEHISQFKTLIAHRLHANIIAYSMGIPSIGLIWDKKVEEFSHITNRDHAFITPDQVTPQLAYKKLKSSMTEKLDLPHQTHLKRKLLEDISSIVNFNLTNK